MVWENKQFRNLKAQYQLSEAQKANGLRLLHSMARGERMLPTTKVASFLYAYILDSFDDIDQVKMADAILEGSIDLDSPEVVAFMQDRYQKYLDACYRLYDSDRVKSAEDVIMQDLLSAKEIGVDLPDSLMTVASFYKMAQEKEEESSNKIESLGFEDFVNLLLGGKLMGGNESYVVSPGFRILALIGFPLALIGFASGLSGKTSGLFMSLLGGAILYSLYSTLNNKYREMQERYYERNKNVDTNGAQRGTGGAPETPAHRGQTAMTPSVNKQQQDQLLASSMTSGAPAAHPEAPKPAPETLQRAGLAKSEPMMTPTTSTMPTPTPLPEPTPPTDLLAKSPAQSLPKETMNVPA